MDETLDYKKAFQESLNSMGEEYLKGARAMFNSITEEVCVKGGCKKCVICSKGLKFLKQQEKKMEEFSRFDESKILNIIKQKEIEIIIRDKEKQALSNEINNLKENLSIKKDTIQSKDVPKEKK